MRLYLDDDSASKLLTRMLRQAGHDVQLPADVSMACEDDPVHLAQAPGNHPGILVVRKDNNPKRDLNAPGILRAIAKVLAAGVPIPDQFTVLNHWR